MGRYKVSYKQLLVTDDWEKSVKQGGKYISRSWCSLLSNNLVKLYYLLVGTVKMGDVVNVLEIQLRYIANSVKKLYPQIVNWFYRIDCHRNDSDFFQHMCSFFVAIFRVWCKHLGTPNGVVVDIWLWGKQNSRSFYSWSIMLKSFLLTI